MLDAEALRRVASAARATGRSSISAPARWATATSFNKDRRPCPRARPARGVAQGFIAFVRRARGRSFTPRLGLKKTFVWCGPASVSADRRQQRNRSDGNSGARGVLQVADPFDEAGVDPRRTELKHRPQRRWWSPAAAGFWAPDLAGFGSCKLPDRAATINRQHDVPAGVARGDRVSPQGCRTVNVWAQCCGR